jgi:pyruvate kinase
MRTHDRPELNRRLAKILATLGPSTDAPGVMDGMVAAGLDGGRINCAHGTPDEWAMRAELLRAAGERARRPLSLLFDLAGPKARLGEVVERQVVLGEELAFAPDGVHENGALSTSWPDLISAVSPGRSEIAIGDGTPRFGSLREDPERPGLVVGTCVRAGWMASNKGFVVTHAENDLPALTDKDMTDLRAAVELEADHVALSFVHDEHDVRSLRGALAAAGSHARVVAKIEKLDAVRSLDAIVAVSDGVMVARGDLGVEAGVAQVPELQKEIIAMARARGKLVITATQMLESMVRSAEPTRAEAADVANAVFDGTSALMLSAETTIGDFPVSAVDAMAEIAAAAERGLGPREQKSERKPGRPAAVIETAVQLAERVGAAAIAIPTETGGSVRGAARHRPRRPIVAVTESPRVARQLALEWGVVPVVNRERPQDTDDMVAQLLAAAADSLGLASGIPVVLAYGPTGSRAGQTNLIVVREVGDTPIWEDWVM